MQRYLQTSGHWELVGRMGSEEWPGKGEAGEIAKAR